MFHRHVSLVCLLLALALAPAVSAGKVKAIVHEENLEETFSVAKGGSVTFENLLGTIRILPQAKGSEVRIRAQVISEGIEAAATREMAQAVELVRSEVDGGTHWTVRFPDARLFRMPKSGVASVYSKWLAPLVKRKTVSTRYDGRAVEIGTARGSTAVSVTLDIEVPMDLDLTAIQHVGTIECNGVRGAVALEVKQGELHAGRMFGALRVTTEGASARVWGFNGDDLVVETGSGKIELKEIRSKQVRIDSARGTVTGDKIDTTRLTASTGSGKVFLAQLEPELLEIESDTGDVEFATELKRTREAKIRSATGNVTVRLGTFASFQLDASSTKGSVKGSGTNIEIEQLEKNAAKLVRGNGGANLSVESDSGQIVIRPL